MQINKLITKVNYEKGNNKKNRYIVIHYVIETGGAENNCKYFENTYRGASANYFVGHKGEIWQCVEDEDIAWHCGSKVYKHPYCRNNNSIGIELCCRKASNSWYFEEETIKAAVALIKELMQKYNIPVDNVIRHYDVTGKVCPEPFVRDVQAWNNFKANLTAVTPSLGYQIRITCDALNVRKGPGVGYKINTVIKDKKAYTIVEEQSGWGKLKSGAGWISLKYTKKIT